MGQLIIGPAWVGDMVMTQALLKALKKQNPTQAIDVLAPNWTRPLLDRMPEVRHSIPLPFTHGILDLNGRWKLARQLKNQYEHAIIIPNSFKSALIPCFAGIKKRTGMLGELRYGVLNDWRKINKQQEMTQAERFMSLAYPKDAIAKPMTPEFYPELRVEPHQQIQTLQKFGLQDLSKPILVLCPGAEFGPSKQWPATHFMSLAETYIGRGFQVWLLGSAKDRRVTQVIDQKFGHDVIDFAGRTTLGEAIDLMALAAFIVSNDSGLMHIAAALKRPLIGLFGSTDSKWTPPLSQASHVAFIELPCRPCFKRTCPLKHHRCMNDLLPERVIELHADLMSKV